jgi:hypothetical protein
MGVDIAYRVDYSPRPIGTVPKGVEMTYWTEYKGFNIVAGLYGDGKYQAIGRSDDMKPIRVTSSDEASAIKKLKEEIDKLLPDEKWEEFKEKAEHDEVVKLASLAIENHKKRFDDSGVPWPGVRPQSEPMFRTPWCYACKYPLDRRIEIECVSCGWIVCKCGACGCGRGWYGGTWNA